MLLKLIDFIRPTNSLRKPYKGLVVDNNDPKKLGRIKVNIFGLIEGDVEKLPWCSPLNPSGLGGKGKNSSFIVPDIGSIVTVEFPFEDPYSPFYTGFWQSVETHQGNFDEDYPSTYGFEDGQGTWFRVNRAKQFAEIQHTSGARIRINKDSSIELRSNKKVIFNSFDNKTQFEFDMESGDIRLDPKNKFNLGGKQTEILSKEHKLNVGRIEENILGSKVVKMQGGNKLVVGASNSLSVLSNQAISIGGDENKLVGGKSHITWGRGINEIAVLGNVMTKLMAGDRQVDILVGNYKINIGGGNILLSTKAGSCTINNLMGKMEISTSGEITMNNKMARFIISPSGNITIKNSLGAGMTVSSTGKVALGGASAELLDLVDKLITALLSHTHGTGVGPSSPPMNSPQFQVIKSLLSTIKGSL